jgi:hypothetical protein
VSHHGFVRVCARNVIGRPRRSAPRRFKLGEALRSPRVCGPGRQCVPQLSPAQLIGWAAHTVGEMCHAQFEVPPPVRDSGFGASHHWPGRRSKARHHFARHQRAITATATVSASPTIRGR